MKKIGKTKIKCKPIGKLKKDLDILFSRYIRLKYSKNGLCRCITCGIKKHWKDLQNGHFVSRSYTSLRWDERNCHPQCVSCNVFKNGNMTEYAEFMIQTYGEGIISKLNQEKHKTFKLERAWIAKKIKEITKKINELEDCG